MYLNDRLTHGVVMRVYLSTYLPTNCQ